MSSSSINISFSNTQTLTPSLKHTHRYVSSGKIARALELAMTKDVKITDSLAARMILPKKKGDKAHNDRRVKQIVEIARVAKKQGSYHLSSKLYTQCGDKIKAMKALLKSGDTKKIIFFAARCRNKSIYVLAANYLTSLNSAHADAKIMQSIIKFYTKAKEFLSLANFYESCAQVEIDEYRDYNKAMQAYREAEKFAGKATNESSLVMIRQHIFLIERFVKARECLETEAGDREEAVRTLNQLLDHSEIESTMRAGDICFVLVKYYEKTNELRRAMDVIEDMRDRDLDVTGFLDVSVVRKIYRANGKEWDDDDDDDDDEIDDNIDDDIDEEVESGKDDDDSEGEDDEEDYLAKFGTGRFGGK